MTVPPLPCSILLTVGPATMYAAAIPNPATARMMRPTVVICSMYPQFYYVEVTINERVTMLSCGYFRIRCSRCLLHFFTSYLQEIKQPKETSGSMLVGRMHGKRPVGEACPVTSPLFLPTHSQ